MYWSLMKAFLWVVSIEMNWLVIYMQNRETHKKEEEKPLRNKEKKNEKYVGSLLNYEYNEADDGFDWET